MTTWPRALAAAAIVALLVAISAPGPLPTRVSPGAAAPQLKRIAFLVESWYPASHADVIGSRFLEGYRLGGRTYPAPLGIASVYTESPRASDQTRTLAARYGFRVAASVADALLEDPRAARPRLMVDGILIATREDPPRSGELPSPTPRLRLFREVLRILEQTGERVPVFIDKMLAANWADAQTIVAEASRRGIPLMAGSVLPYTPFDRPVRTGKVDAAVALTSAPYWAFAFHTAEFLQGFLEQRGTRETGIASIRDVGASYPALPDRDRWGGRLFDALLGGEGRWGPARGQDPVVLLIQYVDGTRAVLAILPRGATENEFLLGAQYPGGGTSTGGLQLQQAPFDHFSHLVHALAEFYRTGRPVVPVERALLTTGIVLLGQASRDSGGRAISSPGLAVTYQVSPRP